jgi:Zn-finger nucleic acid-binding protein
MNASASLICPKCGGEMRSYERNGVLVDQCAECRGIFLDRGELEQLVDAEGRHYREDRGRGDDDRREDYRREERSHKKSKKRSFLENLFEGD